MYEKVKREIVLWLGFVVAVAIPILDEIEAEASWWTVAKVAVVAVGAAIARFKVTPVSDPRNNKGQRLAPVNDLDRLP